MFFENEDKQLKYNYYVSSLIDNSFNEEIDSNLSITNYLINPYYELYSENKKDKFHVIEEKSTDITNKNIEIPINQNYEDDNISIPEYYFLNDIKQIFLDNNIELIYINSIDKYKDDLTLKEAEKDITIMHKGRKVNKYENKKKENFGKFQRGRKKKGDTTGRKHGKKDPDNIIKKIKSKLIDSLIKYINNIITNLNVTKGKDQAKSNLMKKLNYKEYIDSIERKENLNFLQRPIKDILSYEISSKFSKFPNDWNKKMINSILNSNKEDKIINYIFDMTFKEWIEIFLFKKKTKYELIEKSLPTINSLLKDILSKNDEYYLSMFIFYLYNYERWFYIKAGRNRKKSKKKELLEKC